MERAEGNNKIVLKVLSTLLVMYILTGGSAVFAGISSL